MLCICLLSVSPAGRLVAESWDCSIPNTYNIAWHTVAPQNKRWLIELNMFFKIQTSTLTKAPSSVPSSKAQKSELVHSFTLGVLATKEFQPSKSLLPTKMESSKSNCVLCVFFHKWDLPLHGSWPSQSRAVKGAQPVTLAQTLTFCALYLLSRLLCPQ